MSYIKQVTGAMVAAALGAVTPPAAAQELLLAEAAIQTKPTVEQRVHQLLQRAVQHIKNKGVVGVNDFNRDARFVDRDLYVFSLNTEGILLSSGGWSATLIGENVLEQTDIEQRPFFKEIIESAKSQTQGTVQYQWYNPADGGMDAKLTSFELVDGVVVAVGYFPAAPTLEQVQSVLNEAVYSFEVDPEGALRKFANRTSEFQFRGLRVLVLDLEQQTLLFDAAERYLQGVNLADVVDVTGRPFLLEIANLAQSGFTQQLDALILNLKTKRVAVQRIFFKRTGNYVIGVQAEIKENTEL